MRQLIAWLLFIGLLMSEASAFAADAPTTPDDSKNNAPQACDPEAQPVEVEAVGDGWLVSRDACEDETEAWLTYSINDQAGRPVSGTRKSKGKWAFVVTAKIPDNAIVELEFGVVQRLPPDEVTKAKEALSQFRDDLALLIKAAFDEALTDANAAHQDRRMDLLMLSFKDRARKKLSALLVKANLKRFYLKDKPATDALLEKANFRKIAEGEWEPLPAVLDQLRESSGADARALWNATSQREDTDAAIGKGMASPPCLGDHKALTTDDKRVEKVQACLAAFAAEAKKVVPPDKELSDDIQTIDAASKKGAASIPAMSAASSNSSTSTSPLDPAVEDALTRTITQLQNRKEAAQKAASPPGGKGVTVKAKADADNALKAASAEYDAATAAANGAEYAAGLVVEDKLEAKLRANLQAKAAETFQVKDEDLGELHAFVRRSPASEYVHVRPGNPRFFLSTGFVATGLNGHPDKWKLSLPVMASICPSTYGCETKGIGSGGSAWNYLSIDLGVKVVFIGSKDPRENVPSFLLGGGFTPVYATHLSFGVNLFENPQKERVNAAFYAALTLDLVNGKDILGALGIAKPEPQVVGGKTEKNTDEKGKNE